MKLAVAIWLGAILTMFIVASWLLAHDPWITYWNL